MDKPVSNLMKSKSSNSAQSEAQKTNKKTRSNAEFQPLALKKRGVYVEKKPAKISSSDIDPVVTTPSQTPSPKPIPRPNRKMFLNSVLNILSQSTTGTQFPDKDDLQRLKKAEKTKSKSKKKRDDDVSREGSTQIHKKKKSRQKLAPTDSDLDQLVVLKSTKEIIRTPSLSSDNTNPTKLANSGYNAYEFLAQHRANLQEQRERMMKLLENSQATIKTLTMNQKSLQDQKERTQFQTQSVNYVFPRTRQSSSQDPKERYMKEPSSITQSASKKVINDIYGMQQSSLEDEKDRVVKIFDDDPSTLVSNVPKKEEKLYNFFVDLIETTFNVYNVKTEVNPPPQPPCSVSSHVVFEIDENVAKKLDIQNRKESKSTVEDAQSTLKSNNSSRYYYITPEGNQFWDDKQLIDHFKPKSTSSKRSKSPTKSSKSGTKKKRRLQSESFDYKRRSPNISRTTSLSGANKKHLIKKARKKYFIKLLKEQLKMEDDAYEEPQNFFQALKVIARNKRRCQKTIHFSPTSRKSSDGDVHECHFKRRRLLSASTHSSKKSSHHPGSDSSKSIPSHSPYSDTSNSRKNTTITITETSETEMSPSKMSLEVYGFDYEKPAKTESINDDFIIGYESTNSLSETNFNVNRAILKFSQSGTSSVLGTISRSVSNQHGLRTVSRFMNI